MKPFLKKLCEALGIVLICILCVVFSPIILIILLIKTVSDFIKYKKSRYYHDTHEKYTWMCASSEYVVFYNAVKAAELPVEYYRNNQIKEAGYGYFVYKDTLLVCDYDSDSVYFDKDREEWFAYDAKDCVLLESEIKKEIGAVNDFLGENRCSKAVVFLESKMLDGVHEKSYEQIEFLPVSDRDLISSLKKLSLF